MSRLYDVRHAQAGTVDRFRTGPAGSRSADEVAIGHLVEHSRWHAGRFVLWFVDEQAGCAAALCDAEGGVGWFLVDQDACAADAMHCGPVVIAGAEREVV